MVQLKLATTASEGLRPLGAPGQRSFELIAPAVRRALGDGCADLFAEPVASPLGDAIDWYAPIAGTARRLADLGPEEAKALRDRLAALAAAIFAHADRLAAAPDAASQNLAQALRNALEVPDETAIFAVGEQPVLINWAHRRDVRQAPEGLLQAMVALRAAPVRPVAPPPPPPGAAGAPQTAGSGDAAGAPASDWLWWLAAAVTGATLATALWLLVAPCGLAGPAWLNRCPAPVEETTVDPALTARRAQLEAEIAALERRALAAERACEPAPPPPPPPPPEPAQPAPPAVAPPPPDEIDQRRERAGGQQGELTITLVWDSTADLDLYVACPSGGEISYERPTGCGGGRLDVDANVRRRTTTPVENVFFREDAPRGTYRLRVHMFDDGGRRGSSHAFTVRVEMGGAQQSFRGSVSAGQRTWTQSFDYRG